MKTQGRSEVIEALRREMAEWCDDEHSICQVAAERGVFCHGFARWSFKELKERYPQITRSRRALTRKELEDLANRWQLARQYVKDEGLACDVQAQDEEYPQCKGWGEFTDEELEEFHNRICGDAVRVRGE